MAIQTNGDIFEQPGQVTS